MYARIFNLIRETQKNEYKPKEDKPKSISLLCLGNKLDASFFFFSFSFVFSSNCLQAFPSVFLNLSFSYWYQSFEL